MNKHHSTQSMKTITVSEGEGSTGITLQAYPIGEDLIVHIFNEKAHIGAVALAEFDITTERASVSLLTRLGHKDDVLAYDTAHQLCKSLRRAVCVTAGVHIDAISREQIEEVVKNTRRGTELLVERLGEV